jgi:hypothetical protein
MTQACLKCDGVSGNCCYCGGRGFVELSEGFIAFSEVTTPLHTPREDAPLRLRTTRQRTKIDKSVKPIKKVLTAQALPKTGRRIKKEGVRSVADINLKPIYSRCQYCGCTLKLSRLARHTAIRCPQRPLPEKVQEAASNPGANPQIRNITPDWLSGQHSSIRQYPRQARPKAALKPPVSSPSKASPKALPVPDESRDIPREAFFQEFSDRMDTTKGWGQMFRDNGSFGSHPSHDGYDDESSP